MFVYLKFNVDLQNTALPDERAVMTYVSSYYHCFSGAQKVCCASPLIVVLIFPPKALNLHLLLSIFFN